MSIVLLWQKTYFNPLSASPTKWSNTLKQFVGNLATNCLSVFDHFVILALKGLRSAIELPRKIPIWGQQKMPSLEFNGQHKGWYCRMLTWNSKSVYVVRCAIWYHWYNLKNVKNTNGGVLLLVKLQDSV